MKTLDLRPVNVTLEYDKETFYKEIFGTDLENWSFGTRRRMRYNGSAFPPHYKYGFFDLLVEKDVPATDGDFRTEKYLCAVKPLAFEDACKRAHDLLEFSARPERPNEDLSGFRGIANVTLVPRNPENFAFVSSEASRKFLLEMTEGMARKAEKRERDRDIFFRHMETLVREGELYQHEAALLNERFEMNFDDVTVQVHFANARKEDANARMKEFAEAMKGAGDDSDVPLSVGRHLKNVAFTGYAPTY